jgi:hypothetical protein
MVPGSIPPVIDVSRSTSQKEAVLSICGHGPTVLFFHPWSLITFKAFRGNTLGIGIIAQDDVVVSESPTLVTDQETLSQAWVRMGEFGELMRVR